MDTAYTRALNDILRTINTATGVGHPNDLDKVVEIFRALIDGGRRVDHPDEIIEYLTAKGLKQKYAFDIGLIYDVMVRDRSLLPGNSFKPEYLLDLVKTP